MYMKSLVPLGFATLSQAALPQDERVMSLPDIGDLSTKKW